MGYTTPNKDYPNKVDYWPDNDENTLYIPEYSIQLSDIIEQAKEYFGERYDFEKINIEFENIHTSCIHYDMYDPKDWTDFIIISLEQ